MRVLVVLAGLVVLACILTGLALLISGFVDWVTSPRPERTGPGRVVRWWRRYRRWTCRDAPYTYYSHMDPGTGNYHVGIERLCHGHRFGTWRETAIVHEDDVDGRLEAEGNAIALAAKYNTARMGRG